MYQVLQVYTSFSFFENFLSRSIKVGQSSSRRRRLRVAECLYTVTGWGVMSCVCGMAFLSGSTLVIVLLLQAGTVAI